MYIYTYFRMTLSEEESMSSSVSTFKNLDTIVTKEASYNTDASDDFTSDKKQKCSNDNSPLVTAFKEHRDRLKRQLRDKHVIIESLLVNLQHLSHNTCLSCGNQILVKNAKKISICSAQNQLFCHLNQLKKSIEIGSKQQYEFIKGYTTQYCLLLMLEKWKNVVDKGKYSEALLTDLSKAFNCVSHELLIAKLHAYGFDLTANKLIQSYLSNRRQWITITPTYSSCEEIKGSKRIYSRSSVISYFSV